MADVEHKTLGGGTNVHTPGYIQSSDPGAVGASILWVDTTLGTGLWITNIRNAANTGWEVVGGAPVLMEGGTETTHSISSADTDEWKTAHTIAGISNGDEIEIIANATCYGENMSGTSNYAYFKFRISLDNGSTYTTSDSWAKINTLYRLPFALTGFKTGTVTTAALFQIGYREGGTATMDFKGTQYSILTRIIG